MGGTNNPSEEQMELVTARIIELAQSVDDSAVMLEAGGYFDEFGFDLEARAGQLSAKILEYCKGAENFEELDPSIEDHPQPRRMARYLLENVEYDILEKKLSADLIRSKPAVSTVSTKSGSGDAATLFGYPRMLVLALAVVLALMLLAVGYLATTMMAPPSGPTVDQVSGGYGGGGGGRGGGRGGRGGRHNRSSPY